MAIDGVEYIRMPSMEREMDIGFSSQSESSDRLIASGFDAETGVRIRPANASDAEIMTLSAENEYVVLAYHLNFVSTFAAMAGETLDILKVRAKIIRANPIGKNGILALRQMEIELEAGVSTQRSRSAAARGGIVRPTECGGQR